MIFRRIDRYVIKAFLAWFGVSLVGLVGFYLVVDLFTRLHKFFDYPKAEVVQKILVYYLWHTPFQLTQFLPLVTLMAAMFTLARMGKSNELVPIMSSGISLYRVVGNIFLMSVLVMGFMYGLQEWFMPTFADRIVAATSKPREAKSIRDLLPDDRGHLLHYRSFNPVSKEMKGVTISRIKSEKGYGEAKYIYADSARWGPATVLTLKKGASLCGFIHTPAENEILVRRNGRFRIVTKEELDPESSPARDADGETTLRLENGTLVRGEVFTPEGDQVLLRNGKYGVIIKKDEIVKREEENTWILDGGLELDYDKMWAGSENPGACRRQWQFVFDDYTYAFPTSITPRQASVKRFNPSFESLFSLYRHIDRYPDYEVWRVALFARTVQPITNIILLLVGIPFVLRSERRSMFLSLGKCVFIFLIFFVLTFICHNLGESKHLPPWVAVSLPMVMFAAIGLYLFDRIRT